jgi:hypothetical protein
MNNVEFEVYHPTLHLVSDRTFRSLLKKLSALTREVQAQEVLYLIRTSKLSSKEQQSLRDRLAPQFSHITGYYLEDVKRSSLTLTVMLTGVGITILQNTLGKTVEDAWRQSDFHIKLLAYLSSPRKRKQVLKRDIDLVVNNWKLDTFVVEDTSVKTDKNGDLKVRVDLSSPELSFSEIEQRSRKIDVEYAIENGQRLLNALPKEDSP